MAAEIHSGSAFRVFASIETARVVRLCVDDPNGGPPIVGSVIRGLSRTHVAFRADDGLIWAVAIADLRPVVPFEVTP